MGIITGYICLVLLVLLLAKYVTKRVGAARLNRFLQKMHIVVAVVFVVMSVVHFVLVLPVLKSRAATVNGTGIMLMVLAAVLTFVSIFMRRKRKMSIKFHHVLSFLLVIGMVGHIAFYYVDFASYKSAVAAIHIDEMELSDIKDGSYEGEYDAGYIYAKVNVTVEKGKIKGIKILEHRNERGGRAEVITDEMVEKQKIDVDAVSGATCSSSVIKKAVANALANK